MTKLEYYRRMAGMSQEELAEKSGVSRPVIVKIENRGTDGVRSKTLLLLADALNISVKELF